MNLRLKRKKEKNTIDSLRPNFFFYFFFLSILLTHSLEGWRIDVNIHAIFFLLVYRRFIEIETARDSRVEKSRKGKGVS